MTANTIHMSGKPKITYGDLVDFRGVVITWVSKGTWQNPTNPRNAILEGNYVYMWSEPKGYNDSQEIMFKSGISFENEKTPEVFIRRKGVYYNKDVRVTSYDILKLVNNKLAYMWDMKHTISVTIHFIKQLSSFSKSKPFDEIRVYTKHKHADATKRNWEKVAELSKPKKMESKKMYHKKSSTQKSPVKRMTGDIGQLGKNFRKLI